MNKVIRVYQKQSKVKKGVKSTKINQKLKRKGNLKTNQKNNALKVLHFVVVLVFNNNKNYLSFLRIFQYGKKMLSLNLCKRQIAFKF